jgi:hypothetical protein
MLVSTRKKLSAGLVALSVFLSGFLVVQTIYGSTVTSTVTVGAAAPVISSVNIYTVAGGNNPATITLTANATTSISVNATISDNNGCSEITGGTTTILLYRSGVSSSTCLTTPNNLNCYTATAFTASSTCSGGSVNVTTTFGVYYFAQATDGSSSFPGQNWLATINFTTPDNTTGTADSTHTTSTNILATVTALNITTSSINYGLLQASSTTGSVNQITTSTNAGNSSTSLQLSAQATLSSGVNVIATSSQGYSTSTFTYPGNSTALSASPATVSGFLLTSPTTTTNVAQPVFWGLAVPNGTPTGTYNGTNLFTALFHT